MYKTIIKKILIGGGVLAISIGCIILLIWIAETIPHMKEILGVIVSVMGILGLSYAIGEFLGF